MKHRDSAKTIWDWFFAPLVQYKPTMESLNSWLDSLWDVKGREIVKYKALRRFKLPGLYCAAPLVRQQGAGNRRIYTGQHLWVRQESENEFHIEKESDEQVFVLDGSQWGAVVSNLEALNDEG